MGITWTPNKFFLSYNYLSQGLMFSKMAVLIPQGKPHSVSEMA